MARNGSGTYSLPAGSLVSDGQTALASQHNTPLNDIAADLNLARPIVAGGTGGTTKAEAISNLTLATTPRRVSYGGTADAITLTTGASLTALVTGMTFTFIATANNTAATATTINTDGLGAVTAKTISGDDIPADYIRTGWPTTVVYDGTYWVVVPAPQYICATETFTFAHFNLGTSELNQGVLPFFDTSTAVHAGRRDRKMARAGRVIGARVDMSGARTGGTATLKVILNGTATAFDDDSVVLNGTNTSSAASLVSYGSGVAFVAGDTLGVELQSTALWGTSGDPDLLTQLTVVYEPV